MELSADTGNTVEVGSVGFSVGLPVGLRLESIEGWDVFVLLVYLFLDFAPHSLSMHAQNAFFPALSGHCQTVVCGALDWIS